MKKKDLISLLIALSVLISILYKISLGYHSHRADDAKMHIKLFSDALELYKIKLGSYPYDLEALTEPKKNGDKFFGIIPLDSWGNKYIYWQMNDQFEIISLGADSVIGGKGEDADILYSELYKREDE